MDPNANLEEQRRVAQAILETIDACADDGTFTAQQLQDLAHGAHRLAELQQALDQWISRGGFLPQAWADAGDWTRDAQAKNALKRIVAHTTDWANTWDRSSVPGHAVVAGEMRRLRAIAQFET